MRRHHFLGNGWCVEDLDTFDARFLEALEENSNQVTFSQVPLDRDAAGGSGLSVGLADQLLETLRLFVPHLGLPVLLEELKVAFTLGLLQDAGGEAVVLHPINGVDLVGGAAGDLLLVASGALGPRE